MDIEIEESSDESEIIDIDDDNELNISDLSNDESEKNNSDEEIKNDDSEDDYYDSEEENIDKKINLEIQSKYKKILDYKEENMKKFSYYGMLSYLCRVVSYIKNGGKILDNIKTFDYPNITEESYAIESILLNKDPFVYIVNNQEIEIDLKTKILTMKLILRPSDTNKKIFFTKDFQNKFPKFIEFLFNDYVTEEEIQEIENLKKNN